MDEADKMKKSTLESLILSTKLAYNSGCDNLLEKEKAIKLEEKLQPKNIQQSNMKKKSPLGWVLGGISALILGASITAGILLNKYEVNIDIPQLGLEQNYTIPAPTEIPPIIVEDCMARAQNQGLSTWETCWSYVRYDSAGNLIYSEKDLATAIFWDGPRDLLSTTIGQYNENYLSEWYLWARENKEVIFCIEAYSTAKVEGNTENINPGCYYWQRGPFMIDVAGSQNVSTGKIIVPDEKTFSSDETSTKVSLNPAETLFLTGDQFKIDEAICYQNPNQLCVLFNQVPEEREINISNLSPQKNLIEIIAGSDMDKIISEKISEFWESEYCSAGCNFARIFRLEPDGTLKKWIIYPNGTIQYLDDAVFPVPTAPVQDAATGTAVSETPPAETVNYELRPHHPADVGTGVFSNILYSDGWAPYTEQWLWNNGHMDIQRIRREENPDGCDIAEIAGDTMWITSGTNAGITVNGELIGELTYRTDTHGYVFDYNINPGDKVCITKVAADGFSIIFGNQEDIYLHYDSYCYRGNCSDR